jgi:hypothetical protein
MIKGLSGTSSTHKYKKKLMNLYNLDMSFRDNNNSSYSPLAHGIHKANNLFKKKLKVR